MAASRAQAGARMHAGQRSGGGPGGRAVGWGQGAWVCDRMARGWSWRRGQADVRKADGCDIIAHIISITNWHVTYP